MEFLLQRQPAIGDALLGKLAIGGVFFSDTLERQSLAIPAGRYRLLFTVSARATSGELWSPDAQHRLPLIDGVSDRSGIRCHAANFEYELLGCVAVGKRSGAELVNSRDALTALVAKVAAADAAGEAMWITVLDSEVAPTT